MQIVFLILLFVLGACLGSFLCCQVRRLHLKYEKPKSKSPRIRPGKRSICLHCGKKLKFYDNIPIFSWLILKGKCRRCGKKIGLAEIFAEVGTAVSLLALGTTIDITSAIPLEWAIFIVTIVLTLTLIFLAIYDGLYGELPTLCLIIAIIVATVLLALNSYLRISIFGFSTQIILNPIASVLILGGLYLFLYAISKGKWVGDGDWLLGTAIGLALGSPWLALIALFLANFLAFITMAPIIKKKKNRKIHFGPFLVVAFIIVATFSNLFLSILP